MSKTAEPPHAIPIAGSTSQDPAPSMVHIVRGMAVIPASTVPRIDNSYSPIPASEMAPLLKIEGKQNAETDDAMTELIGKGDKKLKDDLGNSTPPAATLKALQVSFREARDSKVQLDKAAAFAADKLSVVANDLRVALRKAEKNLLHEMDDKPGLAEEYKALKVLLDQRSEAISSGIAASKADKAAKAAADTTPKK